MNNNFKFNKTKNARFPLFRLIILSLSFVILGFLANTFVSKNTTIFSDKYETTLTDFYSKFNNCNFTEASTILDSEYFSTSSKKEKLNKDLNTYFTGVVSKVCSSVKSGEITNYQALTVLNEIQKYKVVNSSLDKLIVSLDDSKNDLTVSTNIDSNNSSKTNDDSNVNITKTTNDSTNTTNLLALGIDALNKRDYSKSMSYLKDIPKSDKESYNKSKEYIEQCKNDYKNSLFAEADSLASQDYYTKAIEFLRSYDSNILDANDSDIAQKITSIEQLREKYLKDFNSTTDQ